MRRAPAILSRLPALVGVLVVAGIGATAWAFVTVGVTSGSAGEAQAAALSGGNTPTLSLSARNVTVQWSQSSPAFLGGTLGADPNGGYLIVRYADSGGGAITPGASCAGLRQGAADPLSCTENNVPTGRWKYTATPKYYNWLGAESSRSAHVIVAPAAPATVALVNGGGVGGAYIDAANAGSLAVDVSLPATSLSSDAVTLTLDDGSSTVAATQAATSGAGTLHFTGIVASGLSDGPITIKAKATSSYGDDSPSTSITRTKDTVSPVVTVSPDRGPDSNGWYNHAVTFSASATDTGGSGVASCDPSVVYSAPDTSTGSVSRSCSDNAGNSGSGSASFEYDVTQPSCSASGNDSNWHNSDVTVHLTATDPGGINASGVSTISYTVDAGAPQTITGASGDVVIPAPPNHSNDGTHTIVFHATDVADNQETPSHSVTVMIDTTQPLITATAKNADNSTYTAGSWTNQSVTVTFACADTGAVQSGLATNTVGGGGTQSIATGSGTFTNTGACTDNAGNTADPVTFAPIKIDKTKPLITATAKNADNSTYTAGSWTNQDVTVTFACADTGAVQSGLAANTVAGGTLSAETSNGSVTNTGSCTDTAGNTADPVTFTPIKIDKTAPVVTLPTFPFRITPPHSYNASTWNSNTGECGGPTQTLCAAGSDTGAAPSGVASASFTVRVGTGGNYWNPSPAGFTSATPVPLAGVFGSGVWSFGFPESNFPADGLYTVTATVTDAAGNTSPALTMSAVIDTVAPSVTLTQMNGVTVTFPQLVAAATPVTSVGGACGTSAGVSGAGFDIATVTVTVTGPPSQTVTGTCSGGTWTATLSPPITTTGTGTVSYTLVATQSDGYGGGPTIVNTGSSGSKGINHR